MLFFFYSHSYIYIYIYIYIYCLGTDCHLKSVVLNGEGVWIGVNCTQLPCKDKESATNKAEPGGNIVALCSTGCLYYVDDVSSLFSHSTRTRTVAHSNASEGHQTKVRKLDQ